MIDIIDSRKRKSGASGKMSLFFKREDGCIWKMRRKIVPIYKEGNLKKRCGIFLPQRQSADSSLLLKIYLRILFAIAAKIAYDREKDFFGRCVQ